MPGALLVELTQSRRPRGTRRGVNNSPKQGNTVLGWASVVLCVIPYGSPFYCVYWRNWLFCAGATMRSENLTVDAGGKDKILRITFSYKESVFKADTRAPFGTRYEISVFKHYNFRRIKQCCNIWWIAAPLQWWFFHHGNSGQNDINEGGDKEAPLIQKIVSRGIGSQ